MKSGRFVGGLIAGLALGMIMTVAVYFRIGTREIDGNVVSVAKTLASTATLRKETENLLQGNHPFVSGMLDTATYSEAETLYRSSDGDIIFRTKTGQLVWMRPDMENGRISWRCYGGSWRDVPVPCRGKIK